MKSFKKLSYKEAYKTCNLSNLKFKSTKELDTCTDIIGQERATNAIKFGLDLEKKGYNIYLSGSPGLGKRALLNSIVYETAKRKPVPNDWCYVYNFKNPKEPKAITLSPGKGKEFRKDMDEFIHILKADIPKVFESKDFEDEKRKIEEYYNSTKDSIFKELRDFAKENDIQVQFTPTGIVTVPLLNNQPVSHQQFEQLDEETQTKLKKNKDIVDNEVAEKLKVARKLDREFLDKVRELENKVANFTVSDLIENLKEKYEDVKEIKDYIKDVQDDIISNIEKFLPGKQPPGMPAFPVTQTQQDYKESLIEYKVNVFTDNSDTDGAPVVMESLPNYLNLIGSIEKEARMGALVTDFTLIRQGSISKANGGFLVLEIMDVLMFPLVWDTLKKILEHGELRIEDIYQLYGYSSVASIRPEPVKIDVKVILVGPGHIFNMLYMYDIDFDRLFKVKADFDSSIDKTDESIQQYACVIKSVCEDQDLNDFDRSAIEATTEYSSRLAQDQEKLSLQFGKMFKVLIEADHWSKEDQKKMVSRKHIEKAINEKIFRSNLIEEKIQEMIANGQILVNTEGEVAGQINGLAIYNLGNYTFGKPSRITCETFMGVDGVVNIERRSKLSGNIHDKGVLILSGYLGTKYAQAKPLSLSASVGFEQSYELIDGDSASAAELIALVSSLAEVPIKQNFAITGSVNQKGEIQPIGGVNEKIEGFFDVCKIKGFTGDQGVLIPHQNVRNLMLKKEVVDSIKKNEFNIYPIETIDQAVEILTGQEAGVRKKDGKFKRDTINFKVDAKLRKLALGNRRFGRTLQAKSGNQEED